MSGPSTTRSRLAAAGMSALLATVACGDPASLEDGPGQPAPVTVQLAPDSLTFTALGETKAVGLDAHGGDGLQIPLSEVRLRVLDPEVAHVDSVGVVTALANGRTQLVATVQDASDSTAVHVDQAVEQVVIRPDMDLPPLSALGDTVRLDAEALDRGGSPVAAAEVAFHATDTTVVAVDSVGLVRARSNGTAFVVASTGAVRDSLEVRVRQVAVSLTVTPPSDSIWVLGTGPELTARPLDAGGSAMSPEGVEWVSSDTSIVVVDEQGMTTAVADGTATVTATLDTAEGQATLVVDERGWVAVSADEFGGGRDLDGYVVSFGPDTVTVLPGSTVIVEGVSAGSHPVAVEDVAPYCLPEAPASVDVQKGDTATTPISVRCSGRFAFEDRVPPTYDYQLHYFDELGRVVVLSEDEIVRGEYAWSPDGSLMAFAKTLDGNTDLHVVRADGTDERRLTFDPDEDIGPTWSPDGRRLAFRRVGVREGLWLVDVETGAVEQLVDGPVLAGPSWSPGGEDIFFTAPGSLEPYNRELWSIRSDGTGLQQRTTDATGMGYLEVTWSPDGSRFAVARPEGAAWELVVMDADASNPTVVATSGQSSLEPSWSPDGTSIVFTKHDGSRYGAFSVRADGTGEVALTPELSATSAVYSVDGTHVLFSWTEVSAKNLDGTGLLLLTRTTAADPLPRPGG